MLKFLSLSALTSAVVLATVAITPASAYRFSGGHYNFHPGHYRFSGHRNFGPRYGLHRDFHPRYSGRWAYWHHRHDWHWRPGYGWAGYYGAPAEGVVTYPAAAPAPVCTCLRKDYLDDGAVRFTDTCTQETAISMPAPAPRG